jgi:hypothetical protein
MTTGPRANAYNILEIIISRAGPGQLGAVTPGGRKWHIRPTSLDQAPLAHPPPARLAPSRPLFCARAVRLTGPPSR